MNAREELTVVKWTSFARIQKDHFTVSQSNVAWMDFYKTLRETVLVSVTGNMFVICAAVLANTCFF